MSFQIRTEPADHRFSASSPARPSSPPPCARASGCPMAAATAPAGPAPPQLVSGTVAYPSGKTEGLEGKPAGTCLTCQAVPASDLVLGVTEVETVAQIEVRTLPCRVERKEHLNHDVMRLYLKLPESQRLQFFAGQYLDFILRDGRKRAFSIANAPHDDALIELHVRHVPRGEFTDYVFDCMQEKTILRIQAPLGTFFLREDSRPPHDPDRRRHRLRARSRA